MPDAFGHCEQLVRAADKDRYLAGLFAPAQRRGALFALYAFNVEVARVRELVHNPPAGEIRLQWWRDALERPGTGEARANPVAAAFLDTIIRFRLPLQPLMDMIEARSFDLYDDPMGSLTELEAYADKTSSALMRLAARILNEGKEPGLDEAARHAGIAHALAWVLTAFPVHAALRRLYVPLDVMQRHGARPEDAFAATATAELKAALAEIREVARAHLAQVPIAEIPPALMPAFLPAALVGPTLKRLERNAGDPFASRPLPQWRRQWLLWRAARNPARIAGR
jgi:phytoene synthase